MRLMLPLLCLLPALASCATVPEQPAMCDAAPAQSRLGQVYSDALGQELLELTGSATLRAIHQNDPVTMDYRQDRLTVAWDDARRIVRISCG